MRAARLVAFGLVLGLILLAFPESQLDIFEKNLSPDMKHNNILADYVVHDPILIASDADFEAQGWPGNGTENDPYLIEGFTINGSQTPSEICLMVENTRSYFSVTNCYLFNGQFGIQFDNVSNARIENNEIHEVGDDGIVITGSDFNAIQNNTLVGSVLHSSNHALILYNCDNTTIANNTCFGYWHFGISLSSGCSNDSISNNLFSSNTGTSYGIWLWDSSQNTIFNNTCISNTYGIWIFSSSPDPLYHCYGNILLNNSCDENGYGIWIERCSSLTIVNNTASNNDYNGINNVDCVDSILIDNECLYNVQRGIVLGDSTENCTLYNNRLGWNGPENGLDHGINNSWDDGVSIGNKWGDYVGSPPTYTIPGDAGSVDHYPLKADTRVPTIDSPSDIEIEFGSSGAITWNPVDPHYESYTVLRNGNPIDTDIWYGSSVTVPIGGLALGVYNYTLIVSDTCANSNSDSVLATVEDTTAPTINDLGYIGYTEGEKGHFASWNPSDPLPQSFELLQNGSLMLADDWDGSEITYNVDGLPPGVHNFTLIVYDTSGNWNSDSVLVTVWALATTPTKTTTSVTATLTSPTGPPTDPTGITIILVVVGIAAVTSIIITLVVLRIRKSG